MNQQSCSIFDDEEVGLFATSTNPPTSIVDCEKELMKKRRSLFIQLKNPIIYQEFLEFMSYSKSVPFVILLNLFYTLSLIPLFACFFKSEDRRYFTFLCFTTVFGVLNVLFGWLLYGALVENSYFRRNGQWLLAVRGYSSWILFSDELQSILFFSLVLMKGLLLIYRSLVGECGMDSNQSMLYVWSCNPNANGDLFPMDSAIMLMLLPLLFTCVMRETRVYVIFATWMIVIVSLSISAFVVKAPMSCVSIVIFYAIVSGLILIDNIQQYLLFYLLSRHLKKTIETNQRLAYQNKATEMRHLIANVAHDLKTPLSSFMTGIDVISSDIQEYTDNLETSGKNHKNHKEYMTSFLFNLKSCIHNIRDTNSFMLMTINRCLDYVKASNGLRLVPKNETIDLQETLNLPLQCMTSIQQKMKIILLPYENQHICSHVITDKQWLQENILCLLSNAVKYSAEGEVVIKLTKCSQQEEEKENVSTGRRKKGKLPSLKIPHYLDDEIISFDKTENYEHISPRETTAGAPAVRRASFIGSIDTPIFFVPRTPMAFNKVLPIQPHHLIPATITRQSPAHSVASHQVHRDWRSTNNSEAPTVINERNIPQMSTPPPANTITNLDGCNVPMDASKNCDELIFEVIDTGIGISEEAMKSLFNPFKQTQRLAGGTGLGLYSLAKRIEALKGKYGVHKREDGKQGSVFWFTIPYKPDEIIAADALHSKETPLSRQSCGSFHFAGLTPQFPTNQGIDVSTIQKSELSIILAEDTPSIAKMTTMMLRRQHYQTEVAENGQILLNRLYDETQQRKKYDVVLMDLQMPVMDGLEATRRIREHERDQFLRTREFFHQIVIGVSANSDYETMEEGLKAGLDDFLPKPFSLSAFLESVKRIQEKLSNTINR